MYVSAKECPLDALYRDLCIRNKPVCINAKNTYIIIMRQVAAHLWCFHHNDVFLTTHIMRVILYTFKTFILNSI